GGDPHLRPALGWVRGERARRVHHAVDRALEHEDAGQAVLNRHPVHLLREREDRVPAIAQLRIPERPQLRFAGAERPKMVLAEEGAGGGGSSPGRHGHAVKSQDPALVLKDLRARIHVENSLVASGRAWTPSAETAAPAAMTMAAARPSFLVTFICCSLF